MPGETPESRGEFEDGTAFGEDAIRGIQREHELAQGPPAVRKVLAHRIGGQRMRGEEAKDVVARIDHAVDLHPIAVIARRAHSFALVVRVQVDGCAIIRNVGHATGIGPVWNAIVSGSPPRWSGRCGWSMQPAMRGALAYRTRRAMSSWLIGSATASNIPSRGPCSGFRTRSTSGPSGSTCLRRGCGSSRGGSRSLCFGGYFSVWTLHLAFLSVGSRRGLRL